MNKKIYIKGMTCSHCKEKVKRSLETICGVSSALVNLESKIAVVELIHEVDNETIINTINNVGYEVSNIE